MECSIYIGGVSEDFQDEVKKVYFDDEEEEN